MAKEKILFTQNYTNHSSQKAFMFWIEFIMILQYATLISA